ncbi:hypothetical protein TNCV_3578111 [Trichonephila clavipes]|nr:hypothetical protein TNCV_3578111 [Trichonephila clavipes]
MQHSLFIEIPMPSVHTLLQSSKVICERRDPVSRPLTGKSKHHLSSAVYLLPPGQSIPFAVPTSLPPLRGQHLPLSGIRAALLQLLFHPVCDWKGFLGSRGCECGPRRPRINPPTHSDRMHV